MKKYVIIALTLSLLALIISNAQCGGSSSSGSSAPKEYSTGVLDASFGAGGVVTTTIGSDYSYVQSLALATDNKIVAAGYAYDGMNNFFALARYNSTGAIDTTFGSGGVVTGTLGGAYDIFYSVAVLPSNKILAAGTAGAVTNDFTLARYNSNGTLDTLFGAGGITATAIGPDGDHAYAMAVQADGKIVLGGYASNGAAGNFGLVRYNPDGGLDTSFGAAGITTTAISADEDFIRALALAPDGKIVAAGYYNNGVDLYDFALARYNSNGALDDTFGISGVVTTTIGSFYDQIHALALQADGKIIVGGYTSNGSNSDFCLARYNANGALDASFGANGITTTAIGSSDSQIDALALQSDGRILAAGYSHNGSNVEFCLARYNADGSLDDTFGVGGIVITDNSDSEQCLALLIQPDNRILAGGMSNPGSAGSFVLVRYWK